jgi:pre-mRNA 3'-end-processing factor FIP1
LTHNGKEGKGFPEVRTSSIDVEANPLWGGNNGKPLMEVDIDADLAEHSKPWRLPGTDQTDFFNYGFDEYTWTQYCVRQQAMAGTIAQQKDADAQMKAFFGGGGGPPGAGGGPGGPGGGMPGMPPGMPGMPDPAQMMEMMNQGVIPPEFAQMMQMGGMPGMPPFGNGPQGGQFGGMQQGGGYDSNPNSVSPQPPGQGGFQAPTGPGGGGAQQGFPQMGMEGYSPQQLAIMQDQQGGGGRGGRNRRGGRGGYY